MRPRPTNSDMRVARGVLLWLHSTLGDTDPLREEIAHVRWALYAKVAAERGERV